MHDRSDVLLVGGGPVFHLAGLGTLGVRPHIGAAGQLECRSNDLSLAATEAVGVGGRGGRRLRPAVILHDDLAAARRLEPNRAQDLGGHCAIDGA